MNTTIQKYLPLTALLVIGCAGVNSPGSVKDERCSSLDLTLKAGFSTAFTPNENTFCYRISSEGNRIYESINTCDGQGLPIPKNSIFIREYSGPEKGSMQLRYVVNVSSEGAIENIPFQRDLDGKISVVYPNAAHLLKDAELVKELEQLFDTGAKMLDETKKVPSVCKELLEYKL